MQRPSSSARGYGRNHQRLRAAKLAAEPYCRGFPTGFHGNQPRYAEVLDHILSQKMGGETSWENTQPLCRSCNSRKAVVMEGARPQ